MGLVAEFPEVLLELKTKSAEVGALLESPALPNVVAAWSLNPAARVASDEAGTASLVARLAAASAVVAAGYRVAFHFDPVVLGDGWEDDYRVLVRQLAAAVAPDRVAWVSVGTLRFPPHFLERWGRRLAGRPEYFAEMVPGSDGKLRSFWPLRRRAYRLLEGELRRWGGAELPVYLCMETPEMWNSAFGRDPAEGEVAAALTRCCR
jgi:spore photoproduct lyase